MRVVQSLICRAALLALAACGAAQAQTAPSAAVDFAQAFAGTGQTAPVAIAYDGWVQGSAQSSSSTSFLGFDPSQGVLVGASFSLGLANDAAGLMLHAYVPERGAKSVTASLAASWRLLGSAGLANPIASTAATTLISYVPVSNDPAWFADATQWAQTSLLASASPSQLNALVGTDLLITSRLDSTLSVSRVDPDKTAGQAQAYLKTAGSEAAVYGALVGSAQYSFLAHASASLMVDSSAALGVQLNTGHSAAALTLVAQGSPDNTTGLDFSGLALDFSCTGDCSRFTFARPDGFSNLAAGDEAPLGVVSLAGGEGNYSATYTLNLRDTAAVGATATHASTALSFVVQSSVSAVPEAETWALFAAGLGFLGLTGRRRRAGQPGTQAA